MTAMAAWALVVTLAALGMVVVPLIRRVPDGWLHSEQALWFAPGLEASSAEPSTTLRLDAGEDLRTGKLDARDYGALVEGRPFEEQP